MRVKYVVGAAALVAITAFVGRAVFSQEENEHDKAAKEMAKLASPGEAHKKLEPLVGKFTAKSKLWWEAGKPPIETTAETDNEWVLGKRFVKQTYKGDFMGHAFEGLGLMGYDNYKKKYVSSWCDTATTSLMVTEADIDAAGKILTAHGEVDEPTAGPGKKTKVRTIVTIDADKHVYEMYYTFAAAPDTELKVLEITYERKK